MTVSWPIGVPSDVTTDASGAPQTSAASFQPEVGPDIERPRSSLVLNIFNLSLATLTHEQFGLFEAWFTGPLAQGTQAFVFQHPFIGRYGAWRLTGEERYSVRYLAPGYVRVTFTAMEIDPAPPWAGEVGSDLQLPPGY